MFSTTLAHLESTRTSSGRSYEVLVVDDGSRDGTADLALKLGAQYPQSDVRVVVLEKNVGKGGAVRHGMLHARGRRLLMVDADGASRFEDLELLWSAMDEISPEGEAAVVVGSRAHLVKTEAVVKVRPIKHLICTLSWLEYTGCFEIATSRCIWIRHASLRVGTARRVVRQNSQCHVCVLSATSAVAKLASLESLP